MPVERKDFTILADDGYELAATLYVPERFEAQQPVTVIASATGVPQSYYSRFATYLAEHGRPTLTFDARGIARSAPITLVGFPCRFRDWGILDFPAVIDWAANTYPSRKLHWVGHSYGAFGVGLARNNARVDRLLGVSTMTADIRLAGSYWRSAVFGLMLFGVAPIVGRVMGYVPGTMFGGADLPKGVVLEWGKWCRTPNFLFGVSDLPELLNFERVSAAIRLIYASDDSWLGRQGVEDLLSRFPKARLGDVVCVTPADAAGSAIGHVGFFRAKFRDTLWPRALGWLDQPS